MEELKIMELEKHIIHNNVMRNLIETQISVDQDFNVSDVKPDIEQMISKKCNVLLNGVRISDGRAEVRGTLSFAILYSGNELASMQGSIDFVENLNADGVDDNEKAVCDAYVEDLIIRLVNSRKVNVRAIITLKMHCEKYEDVGIPYECNGNDELQVRMKNVEYAQLCINSTDSLRTRQNFELPQNKPNIAEIIWDEAEVCPVAFQMTDEGLKAEMLITFFVIYRGVDDTILWHEAQENVTQTLDVSGAASDLVCFVSCRPQGSTTQIRPDFDGEDRVFEVEALSELGINAFEEKKQEMIEDCYIPSKELDIENSEVTLRQLLTHNNSKCRAQGTIKTDTGKMSQICRCGGKINIEDILYEENNVEVNGTIDVTVMCLEAGDSGLLYSVNGEIPFHQSVEVRGMKDFCGARNKKPEEVISLRMNAGLERIAANISGQDGLDVKAVVALDLIVFGKHNRSVISEISSRNIDEKQYMSLPLITGYIVKEGDDLWSIAKSHHTTIDAIKACNNLTKEKIVPKDRLILIKSAI